jgi:hypothetical protein
MGTKVANNGNGGDYTPPPTGIHRAVCVSYVDIGTQKSEWQGEVKWQNKVMITWELPDETYEKDGENIPFTVSKFYTKSLHEKSNLRHDLVSWRGREFTDDELKGFDLDNILGKSCQLNVVHKAGKTGGMRAVVSAVLPLSKGMQAAEPSTPTWRYDIGEQGYNFPEQLSDKMKALIGSCREMSAANCLPGSPYGGSEEPIIEPEDYGVQDDDDSIPF